MSAETETRRARLTSAANVRVERQRELLAERIPLGTVSLVAGYAGEGKSSWLVHVTALASRGGLDGDLHGTVVRTIWVNIEDDPARVQVPRLMAAGASLEEVMFLSIDATYDTITRETVPTLPLDIDAFRDALLESGAKLLILDPASSLMSGDLNKREDARRSLDALNALAQELDVSIVLVMHLAKGRGRASEKISGSHALRDAVRSVLLVARDEETDQRVISVDKANYGPHVGKSWAFGMVDEIVTSPEGDVLHVGRVVDLGETDLNVSELINRDTISEPEGDDAESWLASFLTDLGGSAPAKQIMAAALKDGFSKATIQRVGKRLCEKSSSGFQGSWTWTLRQGSHQGSQGSHAHAAENHENHGGLRTEGATKVPKVSAPENVTPPRHLHHGPRRDANVTVGPVSVPVGTAPESGPDRDQAGTDCDDEEAAPVSYLDHRAEIATRAGLLCPVCNQPTGHRFPGYCDTLDNAHALYRADAEAGVVA